MKKRYIAQPRMTNAGVVFTLRMQHGDRECLIPRAAIERLSASKNIDASDADLFEIFHAFETTVECVARRHAANRTGDTLLVLGPDCWNASIPAARDGD
jgi:hypothetical protein